MNDGRLEPKEIGDLTALLRAAFVRQRFVEFLGRRLNQSFDDYAVAADPYPTQIRTVLEEANASLWWRELIREARYAVPGDGGLAAFADAVGFTPSLRAPGEKPVKRLAGSPLELRIRKYDATFDIRTFLKGLTEIESRVCRIEFPAKKAQATGFLVGPDVVMTNYHVIETVVEGKPSPSEVMLRFDYKVLNDGVTVNAGQVYGLAPGPGQWLIASSPPSARDWEVAPASDPALNELDFALLRVNGAPGNDPIGGDTEDPNPTTRKWIYVSADAHDFVASKALYIVQHPDGKPMQVTIDTEAVLGMNGNDTRVRYGTTTEPGSSGSPCFGPDWRCVALHHAGDPKYLAGKTPEFNQGIPVKAIRELLAAEHLDHVLGSAV
jgi:V8-like Glu-specific endopeptidase